MSEAARDQGVEGAASTLGGAAAGSDASGKPEAVAASEQGPDRLCKRVLLVGWDAADWAFIRPMVRAGQMPTLSRFMEGRSPVGGGAAWGNVATLQPALSPMLWTSIATGKTADQHGVHGFTEPTPDESGVRPVASTSRTCKALWNVLSQSGMRSNVVGWYATHPAEPIAGTMVSNQFEQPASPLPPFQLPGESEHATAAWPVTAGSVHPTERAESLAELRVHPTEIDASAVLPFVPEAEWIVEHGSDTQQAKLRELRLLLAQTASVHAVTTRLMEADDWDLTAVYYEGIDRFAHAFMAFHPPKLRGVDDRDFELFQHVMTGVYRFHDMMLETLLKLAGPETAVLLLSDHGYYDDERRPSAEGKDDPVGWHRPFGMVAMGGAGVAGVTDEPTRIYGASLLDATPTVLRLLGLPVAADMPGRAWVEGLEDKRSPDRILSWEARRGPADDGRHAGDAVLDVEAERAAMRQLIELGYVEAPSEDTQRALDDTRGQNALNLAAALQSMNRHGEALAVLDQLSDSFGDRADVRLSKALSALGTGKAWRAEAEVQRLIDESEGDDVPPRARMLLGTMCFADGRLDEAESHFESVLSAFDSADSAGPSHGIGAGVLSRLGAIYLRRKRWRDARSAFERALRAEPDSVVALDGIAQVCLAEGCPADALDLALQAVGWVHHFPRGHLRVGLALLAMADQAEGAKGVKTGLGSAQELLKNAAGALEVCLKQSSRYVEAHRALAEVYRRLGRSSDASAQEGLALSADESRRTSPS